MSDEAQTSCPQTTDPETTYLGVLGGAARMLRELLRSRRVTKTVRIVLSNLDPEAAPELVRVALFGDTMLFFDLLSASPRLANAAVLGAREAAVRLLEVPERLVDRYLPQLLRELDAEAVGEGAALWSLALLRFAGRDQRALAEAVAGFEAGLARGSRRALREREADAGALLSGGVARAVAAADRVATHLDEALDGDGALSRAVVLLADGIRQLGKDHPTLLDRLVRPLVAAGRDALEG